MGGSEADKSGKEKETKAAAATTAVRLIVIATVIVDLFLVAFLFVGCEVAKYGFLSF